VTGQLPPLPAQLARTLLVSRLGDSQSSEVVSVVICRDGDPNAVVVRLTARQVWWLGVRLGGYRHDSEDEPREGESK
jgi:hypothetical protein